jgi:hypothetical protein
MYVCIIKDQDYTIKYKTVFTDRYMLLKELYNEPVADYLIFDLNTSRDLFTDSLFLTFYKLIYLQLHEKNPVIYPVKYIYNHCSCCTLPRKQKWILKKYLETIKNEQYYACANCVVHLEDKNTIDYNSSNINEIALVSPSPRGKLFICLSFQKQDLVPWCIFTTFKEALESTIKKIIQCHDFYIVNNQLYFKTCYYIYAFDLKDNQFCKSCIFD